MTVKMGYPWDYKKYYMEFYGLPESHADMYVKRPALGDYFVKTMLCIRIRMIREKKRKALK